MKISTQGPNPRPRQCTQHHRRSHLSVCLVLGTIGAIAVNANAATSLTFGDSSLFPDTAEIIVHSPGPNLFGDSASTSLAQTFQADAMFDLDTIYIRYNSSASVDLNVAMAIFTVDDVNAGSHAEPPPGSGLILVTESLILPSPDSAQIVAIGLDSPLPIAATTGTEGYALHFSGDSAFQWYRTGSTDGDVYPGGQAYENGSPKSGGRDFVLALSSQPVPEPSTCVLIGLGLALIAKRLRARRP